MQENPRAIIHFVGGETFAVPPCQVDRLLAAVGNDGMSQLQVGTRVTWINPSLVTYIQMPSTTTHTGGDGASGVPRVRVG